MSSPVIAAVIQTVGPALEAEVWDGEIPRYDSAGNPITPESQVGIWPVIRATMEKDATTRKRMFGGQYIDQCTVNMEVWGSERGQEERLSKQVDAILQQVATWDAMTSIMQSLDNSVVRVIHARVDNLSSTQEQDTRTGKSKLLYLGDIKVEVRVHGIKRL